MKITLLAVGTRGDVQPAIALGSALQTQGHQLRILASNNFAAWIERHGLEAAPSSVDMQALMEDKSGQEWVYNGDNPLKQAQAMQRMTDEIAPAMLRDCWAASQDAEAIISSFTTDALAVTLAEKTGARHISTWLQPSLRATRDGRVLNGGPRLERISWLNWLFSKLFLENFSWSMAKRHINRFRQATLGLPAQTRRENLAAQERALVLHGYSEHVAPRASDWPANRHVTGYWFLNEGRDWQPPAELEAFLAAGPPPLAIGFGSMTGRDSAAISQLVVEAIQRCGQRAVLLAGWAGLGDHELPDSIYRLPSAPHDWLFPRVAAVVHHGGAGATAAGLRAGKPTVIVPHFADQPFWGRKVHLLGAGPPPIWRNKLTVANFSAAISAAASDPAMRQRAEALGAAIRAEDGIGRAVALIERHLAA